MENEKLENQVENKEMGKKIKDVCRKRETGNDGWRQDREAL